MRNSAILVFDGDCGFCTTAVNVLHERLPRFPRATPWQFIDIDELALTQQDVDDYAWLIDERSGKRWHGADVFAALLAGQSGFASRMLGHALLAPVIRSITAAGYRWLSANRHRMPGGTPACSLPSSQRASSAHRPGGEPPAHA